MASLPTPLSPKLVAFLSLTTSQLLKLTPAVFEARVRSCREAARHIDKSQLQSALQKACAAGDSVMGKFCAYALIKGDAGRGDLLVEGEKVDFLIKLHKSPGVRPVEDCQIVRRAPSYGHLPVVRYLE